MPKRRFTEAVSAFPRTILDEVSQRQANPGLSLVERFDLLAVATVVRGGPARSLRTIDIARDCGVPESTLYRHLPKPLVETLARRAISSLMDDYYAHRHATLLDISSELALDETVDFPDALGDWAHAYGAIANPASVYDAGLSLPQQAGVLIKEHADMITKNVRLLGLGRGVNIPRNIGVRVLPAVAAYDMTDGMTELGDFTQSTILHALEPFDLTTSGVGSR